MEKGESYEGGMLGTSPMHTCTNRSRDWAAEGRRSVFPREQVQPHQMKRQRRLREIPGSWTSSLTFEKNCTLDLKEKE